MPTMADGGATSIFPKAQKQWYRQQQSPRDVAMILIDELDAMMQEQQRSTGESG
jgi:hypothetical protein